MPDQQRQFPIMAVTHLAQEQTVDLVNRIAR